MCSFGKETIKDQIMKLSIKLNEMKFYAYHGVLQQEQKVGNLFIINLMVEINNYDSLHADDLKTTINYKELYYTIKKEMEIPSLLLEHLVGRICKRLFDTFEEIIYIDIELCKQKPPFPADIRDASIHLSLNRGEL